VDRLLNRSFEHADETAQAPLVRSEIVHFAGITVSRDVQEPGWRWSSHVKPIVQTEWCRFRHLEYAVRGRLHVQLEDGYEYEIVGGEVAVIPPGHDAWVVGDEPFESIAWSGVRGWLGSLEPGVERVVVTLVMTDIVESTPAAKRMGDRAWGDALAHFVDGARDTIASYRGQLVSVTGDGVLARFDGAGRAIRCALALRTEAATFGLPIRAAVHTGEVEVAEADLRGVALHETARMLSQAGANEIIVSATTKALASASELRFIDLGERELRGLPDSYRLYRLDAR